MCEPQTIQHSRQLCLVHSAVLPAACGCARQRRNGCHPVALTPCNAETCLLPCCCVCWSQAVAAGGTPPGAGCVDVSAVHGCTHKHHQVSGGPPAAGLQCSVRPSFGSYKPSACVIGSSLFWVCAYAQPVHVPLVVLLGTTDAARDVAAVGNDTEGASTTLCVYMCVWTHWVKAGQMERARQSPAKQQSSRMCVCVLVAAVC